MKSVFGSFAVSRALVIIFAALGYSLLSSVHEGISVPLAAGTPWFLSMWYQWDANWYMSIIVDGYQWIPGDQSNVAFFPLYPMAAKGAGWLLGDDYLFGGLLLSSAFMMGGMFFLFRLVRDEYGEDMARRSVWLLAIFPTSMFFTTLYTESLFLMTSIAAFYYARRKSWALAGVWGMLAAMTRVTGLLLLLPLAWEYMSQRGFSLKKVRPAVLWLALVPAGLFLYMGYLYIDFGEPLAFAETQATGWGHEFKLPWASFGHDISFLLDQSELWVIYELAATAFLIVLIVAGVRKLPGSYTFYMIMSLMLPLTGGTTKSMSRYLLVVFPLFILMALYTKRRAVLIAVSAVSIMLLGMSTVAFVTGRWVA